MAAASVPTLAGIVSTVIFVSSVLPMLAKAYRTRDLASYSRGNLVLANAGNAVHSVYVFSLPVGPIWAMHGFYLVTSAMMLVWCLRYGRATCAEPPTGPRSRMDDLSDEHDLGRLLASEISDAPTEAQHVQPAH